MIPTKNNTRIIPPAIETEFDAGSHYRAKIGFVLLATEQTVQDDVIKLRPQGVGMHFARAAIPDSITSERSKKNCFLVCKLLWQKFSKIQDTQPLAPILGLMA